MQDRGRVYVLVDGTSSPRSPGLFTSYALAGQLDDNHVLLLSNEDTISLDLTSGSIEHGPAVGAGARVDQPIPVTLGAVVLGDRDAFRYDASTKTWRTLPGFAGEHWTVEYTSSRGGFAILSAGDPDPEAGRPYREVIYSGNDELLTPLPASSPFNVGATWIEAGPGLLRIGGAKTWFDTIAGLASS